MSESIPKVFISYSWTCADRVIELAEHLMGDGVDVVLDKWELKEGQDKHAFMERSVTDPSISKVLMICDKAYAEKANDRRGGVGDETMVISSDVYGKTEETKYIPIIFERDESGKEYVPAYLKSRIYIDLCSDNPDYELQYERLLRNLHSKPEHSKPVLGKMPEYLNEESADLSGVRNFLRQVQAYDGKQKGKLTYVARRFKDEFVKTMLSFVPEYDDEFDKHLLMQIDATKPPRDLFFDYVDALLSCDVDAGSILGDFFEYVYNGTYSTNGRDSYHDVDFEFSHFLIWEMFVGMTVILLHHEKYAELNSLLCHTYFIRRSPTNDSEKPGTYLTFQPYMKYIEEHIKPGTATPNLYTLTGDIAIKREKPSIITKEALVNADLVLYQLSRVYISTDIYHCWFPLLYVYSDDVFRPNQPIWSRMVSVKHCQKLFPLFGTMDLTHMKEMVSKSQPDQNMHYPDHIWSAASIQDSIQLDEIGTMP